MAKSKTPTGLSITRSGLTVNFSWKISDKNYGQGQLARYRYQYGNEWHDWHNLWSEKKASNHAKTTSASCTLNASDWYPASGKPYLQAIQLNVKGNRSSYTTTKTVKKKGKTKKKTVKHNPGWSEWGSATYTFSTPPMQKSVEFKRNESVNNSGTFSWDTDTSDTGTSPFTDTVYQTMLVQNFNKAGGKDANWSNADTVKGAGKSGEVTYTESSATLAGKSYTRLFKIWSRGMSGESATSYAKHVYAVPNAPQITSCGAPQTAQGYSAHVEWNISIPYDHPVETMTAYYAIGTPLAGMACPSDASWTSGATVAPSGNKGAANFLIAKALDEDQCMWVRVSAEHDDNETYSATSRIAAGILKSPSLTSVSVVSDTSLTIEAETKSDVPDAFTIVYYVRSSAPNDRLAVGVLPKGTTSVTVTVPSMAKETGYRIDLRSYQGSYSYTTRGGVRSYSVRVNMSSDYVIGENNTVAIPCTGLSASQYAGSVARLMWNCPWEKANGIDISWADHSDAWESTEEPEKYSISQKVTHWNVGGLDEDSTYYFRVRASYTESNSSLTSAWSNTAILSLASIPSVPTLAAAESIITDTSTEIALTCGYSGTSGATAEIAEMQDGAVVTNGGEPVILATADTASSIALSIVDINTIYSRLGKTQWSRGNIYYLACRVKSKGGGLSEWSDPVALTIAQPPSISSVTTSLNDIQITYGSEDDAVTQTIKSLQEMPLTVTVTGAGEGGTTQVTIQRAADYSIMRPDRRSEDRFAGETVAAVTQTGEEAITISNDMLTGVLDDGASYKIVATIMDGYGLTDTQEIPFEVHWTHQPAVPGGTAVSDDDKLIVQITPTAGADTEDGDYCDIYRLSLDLPELIVSNAVYGTTYVDPYPAFGEYGGHRIVAKTKNQDYITADNTLAWLDMDGEQDDVIENDTIVIDFDGERVSLPYNLSLSNSWKKDFQRTAYLGGSVEGDWNPGVTRDLSIDTTVVIQESDTETLSLMRELADYAGICHIRTPEGSSFAADIQVTEKRDADSPQTVSFSLTISRVDPEEEEGMTLEQWQAMQQEG